MEPEATETFDVWLAKELVMCLMSVSWADSGRSKSQTQSIRPQQCKI